MVSNSTGHASLIGSGFGGYEVQALIGRGATGTVYLARDVALGRPVALKVLLGSLARNPSMVRSFYREAQAAAPLRHPGIVRVYTAGIEGGTPYIAMEYVAGEPLDRFLRRKGQVSWQAALYVGAQVAEALQCAHDAGIMHRDVKPANILLDRQGRVRLADFGIARVCTVEQDGADAKIIGTPQYMSPEQCAGGDVTFRTDLYSLGVTLYQMVAGRLPFQADSPQALVRLIATESAPRLNRVMPDVPDDVARLIAHLLEKTPDERPESARDVCQTIGRLQQEDGGRSAIPKALAAYVREQAQDSPLRVLTPPPSKDKAKPKGPVAAEPRLNGRTRAIGWCALAFATCALFALAWSLTGGGPAAAPAPAIDTAEFASQADGTLLVTVPARSFRAQRLGWAGDGPALLVEAVGVSTSLASGAAGILAIRPDRQECVSVSSPAGALLAEGAAMAASAPLALASSVRSAAQTPSIVLSQRTSADAAKQAGLFFVQRCNDAAPALNPAAAFVSAPRSTLDAFAPDSRDVHAVLRPDGGAICMVVERNDGTNYLVEERVYGPAPSEAIAPHGPRIVPGSVQYTADGGRLVYIRHDNRDKQELWVSPANGAPGTLIAIGYFTGEVAIAADGGRLAAAWSAAPGDPPELRVYAMTDGTVISRLGDAFVGHDAWLPDGSALVTALRGSDGYRQLCYTDLSDPARSRVLTTLATGVGTATAVSADGAWAAGIADGRDGVCVVFANIEELTKVRVSSRSASEPTVQGAA